MNALCTGVQGYALCCLVVYIEPYAIKRWVKQAINAWTTAAGLEEGKLLRPVLKSGKVVGESLSDWAVWSVVETSAREIGIEHFGVHDLRRSP